MCTVLYFGAVRSQASSAARPTRVKLALSKSKWARASTTSVVSFSVAPTRAGIGPGRTGGDGAMTVSGGGAIIGRGARAVTLAGAAAGTGVGTTGMIAAGIGAAVLVARSEIAASTMAADAWGCAAGATCAALGGGAIVGLGSGGRGARAITVAGAAGAGVGMIGMIAAGVGAAAWVARSEISAFTMTADARGCAAGAACAALGGGGFAGVDATTTGAGSTGVASACAATTAAGSATGVTVCTGAANTVVIVGAGPGRGVRGRSCVRVAGVGDAAAVQGGSRVGRPTGTSACRPGVPHSGPGPTNATG